MEGNDIEDLGGGSFRTVGAVQRYSLLDQYAMGLVGPNRRAAVLLCREPGERRSAADGEIAPRVGVTFNGTRRDVLIQDVIAVHGARVPRRPNRARVHRQAFIYVVSAGRSVGQRHKWRRSTAFAGSGRRSSFRRPTAACTAITTLR